MKCWRCKEQLEVNPETCWYCGGHLCHDCADTFGECGHPFVDEPPECSAVKAEALVQLLH